MQLLTNEQKATVCQLAREAWDAHPEIRDALLEANPHLGKTEIFQAWRRVEQGRAVGRQSLTQCTSEGDFLKLCAHFRAMIPGQEQRAARTLARHAIEPRLVALHKLRQACERAGVDLGYPAKICRTQYRCSLDQASEKQLWRLVYTVKNRGTAKRREAAAAARPDDPF